MARTDPRPTYGSKRRVRPDGYVDIFDPAHPLARRDGYIMEHRRVAYDAGILTDPKMRVHHINRDRSDNRIENLSVMTNGDHKRLHMLAEGVTNQHGSGWPMARTLEEKRLRDRDWMREKRRKQRAGTVSPAG